MESSAEVWVSREGFHSDVVFDARPRLDGGGSDGPGWGEEATLADGLGCTLGWAHRDLEQAVARLMSQSPPPSRRDLVEVRFSGAQVVEALSVRELSAEQIRSRDPEALALLQKAHAAGADVVLVRAGEASPDGIGNLAVIFHDAVGAVVTEIRRIRWSSPEGGAGPDPDGPARRWVALAPGKLVKDTSIGRLLAFLAWEITITGLAGVVAQPLYTALGRTVSVPLAVPVALVALVAMAVGWVIWVKASAALERRDEARRRERIDQEALSEAIAALWEARQRGRGDDDRSPSPRAGASD